MISRAMRTLAAPLVAGAVVGLVLAASGGAATGGTFILGQSNDATTMTSLSAPVNNKALQLTNTNTGSSATALGLTVASGRPPFTVNSNTKVANLDADLLDGMDSTALPYWKLGGNAGTDPNTQFLGTTDSKKLVLKAGAVLVKLGNSRVFSIDPTAHAPNIVAGFPTNSIVNGTRGATISGGGDESGFKNAVNDDLGTVGGGRGNTAGNADTDPTNADFAAVAGGNHNTAGLSTRRSGAGRTTRPVVCWPRFRAALTTRRAVY